MKLFCILLLIISCFYLNAFAQPDTLWTRFCGTMEQGEYARDVQETDNGDFLVTGQQGFETPFTTIFVVKYSALGEERWFRTYSVPDWGLPDWNGGFACMALPGQEGTFTIIATFMYTLQGPGYYEGHPRGYLIRCNADGDTTSTEIIEGAGEAYYQCASRLSDGGCIIAGATWPLSETHPFLLQLTRMDNTGGIRWTNSMPFDCTFSPTDVHELSNGEYAIAGEYGMAGWDIKDWNSYDVGVIRTDESGNRLWNQRVHGDSIYYCHAAIAEASNGSILLATTTKGPDFTADPVVHLMKFNDLGDPESDVTINPGNDELVRDMLRLDDGTYLLAVDQAMPGQNNYDVNIVRFDESGQVLGNRTIGGDRGDVVLRMTRTSDGGVVAAGWTWSFGAYTDNFYTIRLGAPMSIGSLSAPIVSSMSLSAFPNPFNPSTTLSFTLPQTGQTRLTIYDALGREVEIMQEGIMAAGEHHLSFDGTSLPSGAYFSRLESAGKVKIQKLFLIK